MVGIGSRVAGGLAAVGSAALIGLSACNAPPRDGQTRMFPKAPLAQMRPVIRQEPGTAMSRLAHLNKPAVVEIRADSLTPARK